MKNKLEIQDWENKVFDVSYYDFNDWALEIFLLQYEQNEVYKKYVDTLQIDPKNIQKIEEIPFLPISFFKSHKIITATAEPEFVFESSGTTGQVNSRHYINKLQLYKKCFRKAFQQFYDDPSKWCILGLLPGYLERQNSSLITMVDDLVKYSFNSKSGFYLYDHEKLYQTIVHNEITGQQTLLIGVTYALLDFAEKYSMKLKNTIVMETGGMKGKREEITREEVHEILKDAFGLTSIHSEYGMTELLSQAYSSGDGIFKSPSWMKILIREYNDPFAVHSASDQKINGLINVIDLANLYSCCFIATDDVGRLYKNNSFEVLGRRDVSDLRGCSLLTL